MNRGRIGLGIGDDDDMRVTPTNSGTFRAETRYRDGDGALRTVTAKGPSRAAAKANLRRRLTIRAEQVGLGATLTSESPLRDLADEWLADVQARDGLAAHTEPMRLVLESAIEGELTAHLGYEKHERVGDDSGGNARTGPARRPC